MEGSLFWPFGRKRAARWEAEAETPAATRFGGDGGDEPVFIATISGPIEIEMARDALMSEGIPVLIKQSSVGAVYGFTGGALGSAEVWAFPALAERARDTLIGIGLIDDNDVDNEPEGSAEDDEE